MTSFLESCDVEEVLHVLLEEIGAGIGVGKYVFLANPLQDGLHEKDKIHGLLESVPGKVDCIKLQIPVPASRHARTLLCRNFCRCKS